MPVWKQVHKRLIDSFEFQELPIKLQNLFLETVNIAIPESYFKDIQSWSKNKTNQQNLIDAIFYIIILGALLLFGLNFGLKSPIWVDEIFSFYQIDNLL